MFTFLLVVHALIAASLVGVILMQRSEGGGFAGGGNPTGLISARGAGDFLTRATAVLATAFILLSIGLAALAAVDRGPRELNNTLDRSVPTAPGSIPTMPSPAMPSVPMGGATAPVSAPAVAPLAAPARNPAGPNASDTPARTPSPKAEVKRDAPAAAPKVALPQIIPATPATDPAPTAPSQP